MPDAHRPADDRYEHLPYQRVGRSGLLLPRISLGLWNNFGADRGLTTQRDIVLHAFDRGVTHFDLANNYGPPPGAAEEQFGRILASDLRPYRDELVISTKAGYDMWPGPYGNWGSRKYMLASLDQSLGRMGLDSVDVFYSHRPDPETPIEETVSALVTAVRSGKALYAGISNYDPEQTAAAAEALAAENIHLLIHQPRYNMFDRVPEDGLFDELTRLGTGAIVFSPLAGGLLTDRYLDGSVPVGSRAAEGRWFGPDRIDDEYLTTARALNDIAAARGQSLAQLAITWVLRQPAVTSALVGASSVRQLDGTLDALAGAPLTDEELRAIDALVPRG
ncbi:L-glyceraldehyde 3-phosphate reductase [Curtobacterium sp. UNCCL20]|uniref:aldo/keto reductase n=1 Tax=Curtobacterium sp. UNCCL20 TaxID=1502773 RepID=UPI0008806D02|nr:aldo/keto reductase [Curtobacterium sp. UNCCL20]SDQ20103.1 L-glyceraldehyde 3-phosphate reductase [Curtobacterium sp. UNCCL20]